METIAQKKFSGSIVGTELIGTGIRKLTIHVDTPFTYIPGQYVWLEFFDTELQDTHGNRRAFSILNTPNTENTISIVGRISDTNYKKYFFAVDTGTLVTIHGPFGSTFSAENITEGIICIAGGVGISVFLPIIETLLEKRTTGTCFLVYLNESITGALFHTELEKLRDQSKGRFDFVIKSDHFSWSDVQEKYPTFPSDTKWWISGPRGMVSQVATELEHSGISSLDMLFENYYPDHKKNLTFDDVRRFVEQDDIFLRALQNSTNHTVITDLNGVVLFANNAAEKVTGYSQAEIIGNTPRLWGGMMSPEFYRDFWKKKFSGKSFQGEIVNRKKNGELYYSIAHISDIFDKDGAVIGFIGTEDDITEIKKKEENIRIAEERWKYAIEGGHDGAWDWNIATNEVFFSVLWKSMIGYSADELTNGYEDWKTRVHPDDLPGTLEKIENHFKKQTDDFNTTYRMQTKSGEWKWILARGKVVDWSADGSPLRMVGTHTDLTEIKQREQELVDKNNELERLNKLMVDRELRMVELKDEIKKLKNV